MNQVNMSEKAKIAQISATDTGSIELQIVMLTERMKELTEHVNKHHKDYGARRSLIILAGKRRRFLNYLKRTKKDAFEKISALISNK